jgi:hypothetical protein
MRTVTLDQKAILIGVSLYLQTVHGLPLVATKFGRLVHDPNTGEIHATVQINQIAIEDLVRKATQEYKG